MSKKIVHIIFIASFFLMIFVPLIMLDTSEEIISEQENRVLTKWPGLGFSKEKNEWYQCYIEDRVGFRSQAITSYTKFFYKIFGEFSESMHMFGQEGYVYPADEGYVGAYQNLRTDEELVDNLVTYLANTKEYLDGKGIKFVFTVGLDKKTVYPEYMPNTIRLKTDNESIMTYLSEQCRTYDIPYVIPVEEMRLEKEKSQIYNQKYDCAHWNDLGRFLGIQLVDEKIKELGLDVPIIQMEDYDLTYEKRTQLEFVEVPIDEDVPVLSLKEKFSYATNLHFLDKTYRVEGTSLQYNNNDDALSDKTILIFHDSFLQDAMPYYVKRYKRVYMISRQNYESLQYYVNLVLPDIVVFENAERAFVDDLYAYTNLSNITYQEALKEKNCVLDYNQLSDEQKEQLSFEITDVENGKYERKEQSRELVVDTSKSYFNLYFQNSNDFDATKEYDFYIKYKKHYYEISYDAIRAEVPGTKDGRLFASFRMRQKPEGDMDFLAVKKQTSEIIELQTIHVSAME